MVAMIEQRYAATADKSLRDVYAQDPVFLDTETDAEFAIRNRSKILSTLADSEQFEKLVQVFLNLTIEFTYASNQFVRIDDREERELRRIYAAYLKDFQDILSTSQTDQTLANRLQTLVAGHFSDLRTNITRFFDDEADGDHQANVILNQVICAEYTPMLQMELFGLRLTDLVSPVLDIGCGKAGKLARYLNANGVRAVGLDRGVRNSTPYIRADWLDYKFEPGAWGTVISHMAFTNHFLFQHLYKHGKVEPYARQYMAILKALKPGGSFYYTPGLPFIEAYLPADTYQVARRQIAGDLFACQVLRIR